MKQLKRNMMLFGMLLTACAVSAQKGITDGGAFTARLCVSK